MNFSRPNITYTIGRLSIYTQNSKKDHWYILAKLVRYLKSTMDYGIVYSGFPIYYKGIVMLIGSQIQETKSTNDHVFTLSGGAITWRSSRQTIIVKSTMKLEFASLEMTSTKGKWLKIFLANSFGNKTN
uniref:Retrovirus-related Pol polyprotein from transposon TNT 1-94 n=1 Tax=Cajanus cajan TaxID=3821 RepID=A0A151SJ32_CAJCA|nr:Retrovirus-related Pol polyprotein from transposon TNT 1-94 [Cajanus cajan]